VESGSASRTWYARKGIQRTGGDTINPLSLAEETVYLVHLVYSGFRPALFSNYGLDLLAERFNKFRMGEKTVQYLRDRLLAGSVQDCIIGGDEMSSLAMDVACILEKLTKSNRLAKPSRDIPTSWVLLMSDVSISFCESTI
jgi:hypothetical protein